MFASPLEEKIRLLIDPSLAAMGYALVQVRLRDGGKRALEVMAERADGSGMSLDDCTEISHAVSALLDVEDPIAGAYQLEVCSPGADRPLAEKEDFERFLGAEAKVETVLPLEGRRRFRGMIEKVENDAVIIRLPEGLVFRLEFSNIRGAKLVPAVSEKKKKR
jgi:ribosome maturation factor RimP